MTTTLRTFRSLSRTLSRSFISSSSITSTSTSPCCRYIHAHTTTTRSTPVVTLLKNEHDVEPVVESEEKKQAIVNLTHQLSLSSLTPEQLTTHLTLAKQHHLTYFTTQFTIKILASKHTQLYQYATNREWDLCETYIREMYQDDSNNLPHYDALPWEMINPYDVEKEERLYTLHRYGMRIRKEKTTTTTTSSDTTTPSTSTNSDQLTNILSRSKIRKQEEKAIAEAKRQEKQAKNSFPAILDGDQKYPITFYHVIELLDACGWDTECRAAYQHAIDTGYIQTPAKKMHHYMIHAISLPRRVVSIAVRTWLYDIKQRYTVLNQLPQENLQIILGKGWRGKYDNPIAPIVRKDIVDMLTARGIGSELKPENTGILLIHRSELIKWIQSDIPQENLILQLPKQIHVKDQPIDQAVATVSSLINEIIRQFEFGHVPKVGLHIITGIGSRKPDGIHSKQSFVPLLRAPLLKLLHDTYEIHDAYVDTRDESMIRITRNQLERWLRYRAWKKQIPSHLLASVAHIKPNYQTNQPTRKHIV